MKCRQKYGLIVDIVNSKTTAFDLLPCTCIN